jgi:hypothetical protein
VLSRFVVQHARRLACRQVQLSCKPKQWMDQMVDARERAINRSIDDVSGDTQIEH